VGHISNGPNKTNAKNFQAECPLGSALPRKQDAGRGYAESS
jgi:hypothetical protein